VSSSPALFPLLALALGVKHAYDADHLLAVSSFLARSKGVREASKMTASWALGHMVTAAIVTVALFFFVAQVEAVTGLLSYFELGVAITLIAIGFVAVLLQVPTVHDHYHRHIGGKVHSHSHWHRFGGLGRFARKTHLHHPLLGVGILQGLASNDELLALFVAGLGVGSLQLLLSGVAVYTMGVMLGMILFGIALTYPLHKQRVGRMGLAINIVSGSLSIVYGGMMLGGLGGLNPFGLLPAG